MATARELILRHPSLTFALVDKENRLGNSDRYCLIEIYCFMTCTCLQVRASICLKQFYYMT